MNVGLAFARIAELAYQMGARDINEQPGCWEHQIDEQWWVALNPHFDPVECSLGEGFEVPPGHIYVEFNGWPAGYLAIGGEGTFAAGEAANEDALIAAVERRLADFPGAPLPELSKDIDP